MLFGTNLKFRISYFYTAFFPAFLLITFSLLDFSSFVWEKDDTILAYMLRNALPLVVIICLFSIIIFSIFTIKKYIISRQSEEFIVTNIVLNFNYYDVKLSDKKQGRVISVQDAPKINSGFIAFVTSTIAPSIILKFMEGVSSILAFFIILVFFTLLMLSNDVFPNLILPIFGIHLLVTKDNYNIFYLRNDVESFTGVKRLCSLGNTGTLARTFVFYDQEVFDVEIERG
ncbi:TPA: hypothetical protein TXI81_000883 [Streptococcus suis]|nr:hypothetical protein [Streptococcus suis]